MEAGVKNEEQQTNKRMFAIQLAKKMKRKRCAFHILRETLSLSSRCHNLVANHVHLVSNFTVNCVYIRMHVVVRSSPYMYEYCSLSFQIHTNAPHAIHLSRQLFLMFGRTITTILQIYQGNSLRMCANECIAVYIAIGRHREQPKAERNEEKKTINENE